MLQQKQTDFVDVEIIFKMNHVGEDVNLVQFLSMFVYVSFSGP